CLASSMVLNAVGTMGELVVLGWLALELTSSPFLVGVALGMRALPLFFVGAPAGVLADRFPRHRLLMLTGAGQAVTAAALGARSVIWRAPPRSYRPRRRPVSSGRPPARCGKASSDSSPRCGPNASCRS